MVLLTDLADVLRAAGLKVVELDGWKTRARPGKFNPKGVLCHHTAGSGDTQRTAEQMALIGRPDLSAPLAQLSLSRTGVVYVMAAGRANHAGKAKAFGTQPAGDGNEMYVGIEAMNTGFEGWTSAQRHAYVQACAALNVAYGWSARNTAGHKETSLSGKIDPGKLSMPDFRADVAKAMTAMTNLTPTPSEEDDMADYAAQLARIEEDTKYLQEQAKDNARRTNGVADALKALAVGLGPTVQAAVAAALEKDYEAEITLTPKES